VVVPFVFGILAVAVFTRLMSPAEYGLFSIIMATSLFVEIIAYHWLNQSILRYYERNKTEGIQAFFTTSIFGFFAMAAITTLIMAAMLFVPLDGRMAALFKFLPLLIFCQAGYKFVLIFLRAMQNSGRYSILTSINAVSRLALALGVLYYIGPKAEALLKPCGYRPAGDRLRDCSIASSWRNLRVSECRLWRWQLSIWFCLSPIVI